MPTPRIDGLDIHDVYQPVTDWAAATNYPLMSCKLSEGRSVRPGGIAYFKQFRAHAVKYRGLYHWLLPSSSMRQQADVVLTAIDKQLGGLQVGEFVQVDWETTPNVPLVTSDGCWEFSQYIEAEYPGRVIVYTSDWLPDSTLDDDSRAEFVEWFEAHPTYPLWFANYNTSDKPTGGWAECEKYGADIWQWTSSAMVPGISKRCDANQVMDWSTLDRIAGRALRPEGIDPQPRPIPIPVPPSTNGVIDMAHLDLGVAGVDTWYTRLHLGGDLVLTHEDSSLDPVLARLPIPATPVTEAELLALLQGGKVRTRGASPFVADGVAPNAGLDAAWLAVQITDAPAAQQPVHLSGGAVSFPPVVGTITFADH